MGIFTAWKARPSMWPGTCQVCGRWPSGPVCEACILRFSLSSVTDQRAPAHPAVDAVEACVAAVEYRYPWSDLIARFKFQGQPGWAAPMAELMWRQAAARRLLAQGALLVPIPVRPARLSERGYNPAWELCRALAGRSGLQALPDALVRIRDAPDQHSLPLKQRRSNLTGAFATHPQHVPAITNARVILVDDVRTTGATLEHAARALRQAGALAVDACVLAQTPPPD